MKSMLRSPWWWLMFGTALAIALGSQAVMMLLDLIYEAWMNHGG